MILESDTQILSVEDSRQYRKMLNLLNLIKKFNFWLMVFQLEDHFVNFTLKCLSFFVFNLTDFKH